MEAPDPEAVRAVAVAANNEAWGLLDRHAATGAAEALSGEPAQRLLTAAYASLWAWARVGGPAHTGRAHHLVSRSAASTGDARLALDHAERYASLLKRQPVDFADFDPALVAEAQSRALACAGRLEEAAAKWAEARRLCAAVSDPEDRRVVSDQLESGPWFGLAPFRG